MELCILLPQRDQILPPLWILPHALHSDVAHVQSQVANNSHKTHDLKSFYADARSWGSRNISQTSQKMIRVECEYWLWCPSNFI